MQVLAGEGSRMTHISSVKYPVVWNGFLSEGCRDFWLEVAGSQLSTEVGLSSSQGFTHYIQYICLCMCMSACMCLHVCACVCVRACVCVTYCILCQGCFLKVLWTPPVVQRHTFSLIVHSKLPSGWLGTYVSCHGPASYSGSCLGKALSDSAQGQWGLGELRPRRSGSRGKAAETELGWPSEVFMTLLHTPADVLPLWRAGLQRGSGRWPSGRKQMGKCYFNLVFVSQSRTKVYSWRPGW